jgi:hypothetical protein
MSFIGVGLFYIETDVSPWISLIFLLLAISVSGIDYKYYQLRSIVDIPNAPSYERRKFALDHIKFVLGASFMCVVPYIYYLATNGPPIFQDNPEISRVILQQDLGFYNRIWQSSLYIMAFLYGWLLCFNPTERLKIIYTIIGIFIVLMLIVFSGFRSRIVDVLVLFFIGYISANYIFLQRKLFNFRKVLLLMALVSLAGGAIVYLTMLRFHTGVDFDEILSLIFNRVFILNAEINIERVTTYVNNNEPFGLYGLIKDYISIFDVNTLSMQQEVTFYYTDTFDMFVMTPTMLGEAILLFGEYYYFLWIFVFVFYGFLIKLISAIVNYLSVPVCLKVSYYYISAYIFIRGASTLGLSSAFITKVIPLTIMTFLLIILYFLYKKLLIREV